MGKHSGAKKFKSGLFLNRSCVPCLCRVVLSAPCAVSFSGRRLCSRPHRLTRPVARSRRGRTQTSPLTPPVPALATSPTGPRRSPRPEAVFATRSDTWWPGSESQVQPPPLTACPLLVSSSPNRGLLGTADGGQLSQRRAGGQGRKASADLWWCLASVL